MFQRRSPLRPAPRTRSLALGGALAALAVVGGGTVVAVTAPSEVDSGEIRLAQNTAAQEMELGTPVDLDLEPVVARAAGGTIPEGTTVQVTGLPDGLVQNGWVISGTPTRAGTYDVLVTVSNSGASESEKVSITVADDASGEAGAEAEAEAGAGAATEAGAGAATAAGAETATTEAETSDAEAPESPTTGDAETGDPEPTLSAVPGDNTLTTAGADTEAGTGEGESPDLCAIVDGGDGGDGADATDGESTDGAALAAGLAPLLAGDGEDAPAGLALVLVNAISGLLPSLLGEGGSAGDVGSFGQILCTLGPGLLTGGVDETAGDGAAEDGATSAATAADGATPADGALGADAEPATAAAATGATGAAALLSGLMGAGAGSLGG